MKTEPRAEHRWLQQLVGDWSYEAEAQMGPGGERFRTSGSENVRAFGDLWVIAEGKGTAPDGSAVESIMTIGFDPARGRFVGTWIGSPMPNLWVYDAALDETGRVLPLTAEGPSMSGDGGTAEYQDVITIDDDRNRRLTARVLGADGNWTEFMWARYRRIG